MARMLWPLFEILEQFVEQIAVARPVPQMMVRIDDRPVGLERLFLGRGEPVLADRQMTRRGRGIGLSSAHPSPEACSKSATGERRMPRF